MANLCTGAITFYSENEEVVKSMMHKFKEIFNSPPTFNNSFGNGWMGDYANTFFPDIGHEKIPCRGCIELGEFSKIEKYFYFEIYTQTANSAKIGLWHHIVEKYYPDISIAYIAEECGCGYFVKWDETGLFYSEEYYVDG